MSMADFNSLIPFINILLMVGIVPLFKTLSALNINLEKLCMRIDFMENDIAEKQILMGKNLDAIAEKLQKHLDGHQEQCHRSHSIINIKKD